MHSATRPEDFPFDSVHDSEVGEAGARRILGCTRVRVDP
jgi:hypothetical protein